jgi:hypothetical protein
MCILNQNLNYMGEGTTVRLTPIAEPESRHTLPPQLLTPGYRESQLPTFPLVPLTPKYQTSS